MIRWRTGFMGLVVLVTTASVSAQQPARGSSVLDWQALATYLPESIPGYDTGKVEGGAVLVADPANPEREINHSRARRRYLRETEEGEQSYVTITIVDAGRSKIVLDPFLPELQFADLGGEQEQIEIKGRRGAQMVRAGESDIALGVIYVRLGERMVVVVTGEWVRDVAELQGLAGSVDYDGLERAMIGKR